MPGSTAARDPSNKRDARFPTVGRRLSTPAAYADDTDHNYLS
jgi:hypothetical protein